MPALSLAERKARRRRPSAFLAWNAADNLPVRNDTPNTRHSPAVPQASRVTRRTRLARIVAGTIFLCTLHGLLISASAATVVGDGGHYLRYAPKVYLYNPDGQAFTMTVHLMRWPIKDWNPTRVTLRLSDPAGNAVVDGNTEFEGASKTFAVPAMQRARE